MRKKISDYRYVFIAACCIFFFNPFFVFAQEEVLKVSLDDAINMAVKESEDILIKDNEVSRSGSKVREERSEILPHVSGSAVWSKNYKYPDIPATALTKEYDFNTGLSLDQKLFTFGRIGSAISAAKRELEGSRYDKEDARHEVIYLVKTAYYNVCLAKKVYEITQESLERVKTNKAILEKRAAGGRASKYDNIKMAADLGSRMPMVSNARANLNSALQTLKRLIGMDAEREIDIVDDFPKEYSVVDRQTLTKELLLRQPLLKSLEKNVEATKDKVWEKRAEYFPEISVFSTWNHKGSGDSSDIGNDNLNDYGIAGLKVTVPIWEGGKRKEELSQARIDKSNAELNLKRATKNLRLELDSAIVRYNEYVQTLYCYDLSVRMATEAFKLSQDMFHSGQLSITDLNSAELLLTNEKINRATALFNINETLAKINKLIVAEDVNE